MPNKYKYSVLLLLFLGYLLFSGVVKSIEIENQDEVHISNLHVLDDDLIALANHITVDGEIKGDLIGIAKKIVTNGKIKNSVTVIAEDYINSGKIEGSLRMIVKSAQIDGYVDRSVLAICLNRFHLGLKGHIGHDAIILANRGGKAYFEGSTTKIDGYIQGSAKIRGDKVVITGRIDGDLEIDANDIQILPPAIIKGDFTYTSENQAHIDISSGVTIIGDTRWNLPDDTDESDSGLSFTDFVHDISELLAIFIFGVILITLTRQYINESMNQLVNRFGHVAAFGFLSVIILIVCFVILIISLVLMLVGYALISSDNTIIGVSILAIATLMVPITSFITAIGGMLLFTGKVVIAILLGYYISLIFKPKTSLVSKSKLFIGLICLFVLSRGVVSKVGLFL